MTTKKAKTLFQNFVCRIIPSNNSDKSIEAIMSDMMLVINDESVAIQVKKFAKDFKGSTAREQYKKLRKLHSFLRENFRYVADPSGGQVVKEPACAWSSRGNGMDCKSFTCFVYFVCYELGIPCYIDFLFYSQSAGHVYPTALIGNREVVIDATLPNFDTSDEGNHVQQKVRKMSKAFNRLKNNKGAIAGAIGNCGTGRCGINKIPTRTPVGIRNISLPAAPFLNIAAMTGGTHIAHLVQRNLELRGALETDRTLANELKAKARFIKTELRRGLHNTNRSLTYSGTNAEDMNNYIAYLRQDTSPAIQLPASGSAVISGRFDATPAQLAACNKEADAAYQRVIRIEGQREAIKERAKVLAACAEAAIMTNIINTHLEKSGAVMTYYVMPNNENFNARIQQKIFQQTFWIEEAAEKTGLSVEAITLYCENGVMANLKDTPAKLKEKLEPYMVIGGASIGEPLLSAAAIKLIGTIVKILIPLLTSITAFIDALREEQRQEDAFLSIKDLSVLAMAKADFNGNGIADEDEGFTPDSGGLSGTQIGLGLLGLFLVTK